MSSKPPEALAPTLAEAVRCPLLEERQEEWIACCTARFLPLARRVTKNDAVAEDVLHDTWIIALDKVHQFHGKPPACGWSGKIVEREAKRAAVRRARDAPRATGGAGDGEAETIRSDAASPEDAAHERQMLRLLLEVVDGLPPIYREVVRLRDIEERSEKGDGGPSRPVGFGRGVAAAPGAPARPRPAAAAHRAARPVNARRRRRTPGAAFRR